MCRFTAIRSRTIAKKATGFETFNFTGEEPGPGDRSHVAIIACNLGGGRRLWIEVSLRRSQRRREPRLQYPRGLYA